MSQPPQRTRDDISHFVAYIADPSATAEVLLDYDEPHVMVQDWVRRAHRRDFDTLLTLVGRPAAVLAESRRQWSDFHISEILSQWGLQRPDEAMPLLLDQVRRRHFRIAALEAMCLMRGSTCSHTDPHLEYLVGYAETLTEEGALHLAAILANSGRPQAGEWLEWVVAAHPISAENLLELEWRRNRIAESRNRPNT